MSCLWQKSGEDGLLGRGLLRGAALSRKKDNVVTVTVHGVGYSEFANLKWHQFLRGFSASSFAFGRCGNDPCVYKANAPGIALDCDSCVNPGNFGGVCDI